jgi:hypothetical protein
MGGRGGSRLCFSIRCEANDKNKACVMLYATDIDGRYPTLFNEVSHVYYNLFVRSLPSL